MVTGLSPTGSRQRCCKHNFYFKRLPTVHEHHQRKAESSFDGATKKQITSYCDDLLKLVNARKLDLRADVDMKFISRCLTCSIASLHIISSEDQQIYTMSKAQRIRVPSSKLLLEEHLLFCFAMMRRRTCNDVLIS